MVVYSAFARFDPYCGKPWADYLNWSGLTHLTEVVSLDIMLCPTIFRNLTDEDWLHNVQADCLTHLFHDLNHVVQRADGGDRVMILALVQHPTMIDVDSFNDPRFAFMGFDLVDHSVAISALVNCGGFDRAFAPKDLSVYGLLRTHSEAVAVQKRLREEYSHEIHAACDLWAIWRMK